MQIFTVAHNVGKVNADTHFEYVRIFRPLLSQVSLDIKPCADGRDGTLKFSQEPITGTREYAPFRNGHAVLDELS
jgi:hypothetical protein